MPSASSGTSSARIRSHFIPLVLRNRRTARHDKTPAGPSLRMSSIAVFSPAKINLFLAVTARRSDGFHDLVSVVAPLSFGDSLWLHAPGSAHGISLACDDPAVR